MTFILGLITGLLLSISIILTLILLELRNKNPINLLERSISKLKKGSIIKEKTLLEQQFEENLKESERTGTKLEI